MVKPKFAAMFLRTDSEVDLSRQISPCPVCLAHEARLVSATDRHGKPLTTMMCDACGHVFNDPVPSAEELAAFYARDYRVSYKGAARPRGRQVARNFGRVEQFWADWGHVLRGRRRILDIGAGSGEFLFFAQALGHETDGVEPNEGYAAWCRDDLRLPVRTATIEDLERSEATYDFIRLNHVLEHLRDPVEALERAARRLAPDGVLYVEVPNVEVYARVKTRGNMFHYGHISNFSPWTLRAAAGRAGLAELADTAGAMQDRTAGFFQKASSWSVESARKPENAQRVRAALEAHAATGPSLLSQAAKLARKMQGNIEHTWIAARMGSPRMIGGYYVERLAAGGWRPASQRGSGLTPSRT